MKRILFLIALSVYICNAQMCNFVCFDCEKICYDPFFEDAIDMILMNKSIADLGLDYAAKLYFVKEINNSTIECKIKKQYINTYYQVIVRNLEIGSRYPIVFKNETSCDMITEFGSGKYGNNCCFQDATCCNYGINSAHSKYVETSILICLIIITIQLL